MDQKIRGEKRPTVWVHPPKVTSNDPGGTEQISRWLQHEIGWISFSTCSKIPCEYIVIQWDRALITLDRVFNWRCTAHTYRPIKEKKKIEAVDWRSQFNMCCWLFIDRTTTLLWKAEIETENWLPLTRVPTSLIENNWSNVHNNTTSVAWVHKNSLTIAGHWYGEWKPNPIKQHASCWHFC